MTVVGTAQGNAGGTGHEGVRRFAGLVFVAPPDSWDGICNRSQFGSVSALRSSPFEGRHKSRMTAL